MINDIDIPSTEASEDLYRQLARLRDLRVRQPSPASHLHGGLELQTDPAEYYWDGLRRGGDPAHPFVVVQYGLAGHGIYENSLPFREGLGVGKDSPSFREGLGVCKIDPETVFVAVVPSAHRYYLPRTSTGWAFFYVLIRHPYAVDRLIASTALAGPVHRLGVDARVTALLASLYEQIMRGQFRDDFDEESRAIEFAIEFDRFAHHAVYPQTRRETLLDTVRAVALEDPTEAIDVEEIARRFDMSRSGFTHHFKDVAGISPAMFVRRVRLELAATLLAGTDRKLEAIADATGFASANDLCRVFRRHFHQSPTAYRRLTNVQGYEMRG